MKFSRNLLFAFAASALVGTSLGCYTMLKHPRVQTDDRNAALDEEDMIAFGDDCSSCHSMGSLRMQHHAVPPPRRIISPTWDYYYDNPWWGMYYTPSTGANASAGEEQKKRPFDRRHQSRPDDNNAPTAATPEPAAGSGTIAKPADSGSGSPTPASNTDTNKREEKRAGDNSSGGERRTRKP